MSVKSDKIGSVLECGLKADAVSAFERSPPDCRVTAEMLLVLKNLANAVFEMESQRGSTQATTFSSWTYGSAHGPLSR